MNDPDLSVSDDALAVMRRNELVALLNRLYSRCGEPALTTSTAGASSDDELRDRIRGVRRRVLARERMVRVGFASHGITYDSEPPHVVVDGSGRLASPPVRGAGFE